jgi:hypothetical protein
MTEHDIEQKQEFVETQNERIKTMHEVLNELIEYRIVLEKASLIIHGQMRNISESLHSLSSE